MSGRVGSSTTTVSKLPAYVEPYVTTYLAAAEGFSNRDFTLYWNDPDNLPTYALQDASELLAQIRMATRGRDGNATIADGIVLVTAIINGVYLLGTDEFFQAMLSKFQDQLSAAFTDSVIPIIGVSPMRIGPTKNDNFAVTLCGTTISKFSGWKNAKMYFDNYRVGRVDQHQALAYGIEHSMQSYRDAETLRLAGMYAREWLQGSYKDLYDKWISEQMFKIERLEILGNAIRALVGSHQTKTQPFYGPSPITSTLSGVAAGAGIGFMVYGAPGAAVGAVIGGIAGLASSQM